MRLLCSTILAAVIYACDVVSDVLIPGTNHDQGWDMMTTAATGLFVIALMVHSDKRKGES